MYICTGICLAFQWANTNTVFIFDLYTLYLLYISYKHYSFPERGGIESFSVMVVFSIWQLNSIISCFSVNGTNMMNMMDDKTLQTDKVSVQQRINQPEIAVHQIHSIKNWEHQYIQINQQAHVTMQYA